MHGLGELLWLLRRPPRSHVLSYYLAERKERETYEQRLSGRQIFEHKRYKSDGQEEDEDDAADEVDYSKYDRDENRDVVDDKEEGILLADSDSD